MMNPTRATATKPPNTPPMMGPGGMLLVLTLVAVAEEDEKTGRIVSGVLSVLGSDSDVVKRGT